MKVLLIAKGALILVTFGVFIWAGFDIHNRLIFVQPMVLLCVLMVVIGKIARSWSQ